MPQNKLNFFCLLVAAVTSALPQVDRIPSLTKRQTLSAASLKNISLAINPYASWLSDDSAIPADEIPELGNTGEFLNVTSGAFNGTDPVTLSGESAATAKRAVIGGGIESAIFADTEFNNNYNISFSKCATAWGQQIGEKNMATLCDPVDSISMQRHMDLFQRHYFFEHHMDKSVQRRLQTCGPPVPWWTPTRQPSLLR